MWRTRWSHAIDVMSSGRQLWAEKQEREENVKKQILAPFISNCLSLGFKSYKTAAKELRQSEKTMLKANVKRAQI